MISVIVAGTTHSLDNGTYCYFIGDEGMGMPPAQRIDRRGPAQHGVLDDGFRLEPRQCGLYLEVPAVSRSELYTNRKALLGIFKPWGSYISLRYDLDNGDVRQLDCHFASDFSLASGDRTGFHQRVAVRLRAPDPSFYDPSQKSRTFYVVGADGLSFPIGFPIPFSGSIITGGEDLEYVGSWQTYPTIILTGPLQNPRIENVTTGDRLELEYNLIADEVVTIVLTPGAKTITNNDTPPTNLIGTLSDDSDLGTFHLAAHPDATGGINVLTVDAGGATVASKIELEWYNRYIGI